MSIICSEAFGDSNIGLITGDSAINKDAQVVIMTTEILRNMLYQRYIIACLWLVLYLLFLSTMRKKFVKS